MKKLVCIITIFIILLMICPAFAAPMYSVSIDKNNIVDICGVSYSPGETVNIIITDYTDKALYIDSAASGSDAAYSFRTRIPSVGNLKIKVGGSFTDTPMTTFLNPDDKAVYVSKNGSDSNQGTAASPVKSFEKAVSLTNDNGTIRIIGEAVLPQSISYTDKAVKITGGIIDMTEVDSPIWDGNIEFVNINFKSDAGQTISFAKEAVFGENIAMSAPLGLIGGEVTIKSGAYSRVSGEVLYIYSAEQIAEISQSDIIIFQDGANFLSSVSDGYEYLILSGRGGKAYVSNGKVKILPYDGLVYSVDGGSYSATYASLSRGAHSIEYAYDFALNSLSLKESAEGYTASVSAFAYNLNNDPNASKPVVAVGVYSGGSLVQMACKEVESLGAVDENFELSFEDAGDFEINVFVWNSFDKLQPLTSFIRQTKRTLYEKDKVFYVSPNGRKGALGSLTDPFSSLEEARDAARGVDGMTTVYLRGGEYNFSESISFTSKDINTVYKPYKDEEVIFTTTQRIPVDTFAAIESQSIKNRIISDDARNKVLAVNLPALGIANLGQLQDFDHNVESEPVPTLSVDGKKMPLATYPNAGYLEIGKVRTGSIPAFAAVGLGSRPSYWTNADALRAYGYFKNEWANCAYIGRMEYENSEYYFASDSIYDYSVPAAGQRVRFENLLEEIDSPGEWYLDRQSGTLYIYPPQWMTSGSVMEFTAYRDNMPGLLNINGSHDITFEGIRFDGVGAGAFDIKDAKEIIISGCGFNNILGNVITAENVLGCVIAGNTIKNVGRAGISINGGNAASLTGGENIVHNNIISDYAQERKTYNPAVYIKGVGTLVSNNEISNAPHSAVIFSGQNHVIEFNKIFNVCLETADSGAVYSGRSWAYQGNIIRYNYFSGINKNVSTGYDVHGVYLDDMYSSAEVYGNAFSNCQSAGLIGGGRSNEFYNNILINCTKSLHIDARGVDQAGYLSILIGNLLTYWNVYSSDTWREAFPLLYDILSDEPEKPKYNRIAGNILYETPSFTLSPNAAQYIEVSDNITLSDTDDFLDYENGIFTMKTDSEIFTLLPNFFNIPFHKIGRIGE